MNKEDMTKQQVYRDTCRAITHLLENMPLSSDHIVVIGTSTSEVAGQQIGTSGSLRIAEEIYQALFEYANQFGFHLAFQCCEHLNRALVVEQSIQRRYHYDEVSVMPAQTAGGSLATVAYRSMQNPVLIEHIRADAGIDIGETIIGMHLKPVAIPIRYANPFIGQARVLVAITRPKLIGGIRAVYE